MANYSGALIQATRFIPRNNWIEVGQLIVANAIDTVKPNRLGSSQMYLTFDGQPLNIYDALGGFFPPRGVTFRTPVFSTHSGVVQVGNLKSSGFMEPFTIEEIGSTLGFGGHVHSSYIRLVRRAQKLINRPDMKSMLRSKRLFTIMNSLYDAGVFVSLDPIGEPLWDTLSGYFRNLNIGDLEEVLEREQVIQQANIVKAERLGMLADGLRTIQPDNIMKSLGSALMKNPMLLTALVIGAIVIGGGFIAMNGKHVPTIK